MIVDEASLAGTFALDELVSAARDAGAKVLLVGDRAQLSAVDAGGASGCSVTTAATWCASSRSAFRRPGRRWRCRAAPRRDASMPTKPTAGVRRRAGSDAGRPLPVLEDRRRCRNTSLMIAPDSASVAELNARARADRVAAGQVDGAGLTLRTANAGSGTTS